MDDDRYQSFIPILDILHTITKMDIRLADETGSLLVQIVNHTLPAALVHAEDDYVSIHDVLKRHKPGHYYPQTNSYGLAYIAAGLWQEQTFCGSIRIGPFLSHAPVMDLVKDVILNNNLPISERTQLEHFYESLPVISEIEHQHLGQLLGHLCLHSQIQAEPIIMKADKPLPNTTLLKSALQENKAVIEQRYKHQNELIHAIASGDKQTVNRQITHFTAEMVEFSDRVPGSPIRSSKNIGFVLNTMCRMAAERAGVHPVYLHNISERFAIQIEKTSTIPQLKSLYLTMANDYCDLVISVSTGHYSPVVKKAVDYILLNLGSPLPLKQIAAHVHLNPAHLSRKFKADTGMTITDFINRKRVEEAAQYLQRGNISITEAAFMVGFNDLNYFSKVFKKVMSETPSHYARSRM